MTGKKPFYLTTPIYYPSDKLHVGHTYTTVAADALARFKRMQGYDVMFVTGTDEHGQKIQRKAQESGVTPQAYVDKIVAGIKDLWQLMDITYDRFIRTTDDYHELAVQQIFQKLYDSGDIYKGVYQGLYCAPCEAFWTESQLVDGKCPDCGRAVEETKEEAYFFRLSKYQDFLLEYFGDHPDFLQPQSRVNEMIQNFLRPGLEDLCVSRTSFDWGVKVPFDPKHVVYVWIDALSNYINVLGYPEDKEGLMAKYWPANVHLVGKEIVRFHAIIWPAMLKALNLPLPQQVFGHGWLLLDGGKMSKSKGNVIDPVILCQRFGVDALRYFLMREVQFGSDGNFSTETFLQRINTDLCNDLGNLVSRTAAMIEKYFGGVLPTERQAGEFDEELTALVQGLPEVVSGLMDQMHFSAALAEIWKVIRRCNKYIDETMPWVLAKDEANKPRLASVLFHLAESLRIIAILLEPFMPATPAIIRCNLGIENPEHMSWESAGVYGLYGSGEKVNKTESMFPRLDIPKEMDALGALDKSEEKASEASPKAAESKAETAEGIATYKTISYDEFCQVKLQVGKILACEKVQGADKLLKSTIDLGSETRTILSGIAESYKPEELVGRLVVVVTNLAPRKIRGIVSHGMVLCAVTSQGYRLITPDAPCQPGDEVS